MHGKPHGKSGAPYGDDSPGQGKNRLLLGQEEKVIWRQPVWDGHRCLHPEDITLGSALYATGVGPP